MKIGSSCPDEVYSAEEIIGTAIIYCPIVFDDFRYILDGLECKLTMLNPDDLMVQRILQNIQASSSCSVEAVFEVNSREPIVAFNENALEVSNHRYFLNVIETMAYFQGGGNQIMHKNQPKDISFLVSPGKMLHIPHTYLIQNCF